MNKKNFFNEIVEVIKKEKLDKNKLSRLKIKLCKKYNLKDIPTDIEILLNAPEKDIPKIKKILLTKPVRTISGVAVVAIMTKPYPCPHAKTIGPCIYCPGGPKSYFGTVPQSYTGKEPATRRAIRNRYDPYLQVMNRLEQYIVLGHVPDKIELIIMGGTFPSFPKEYQKEFITYSFKAMNDFSRLFFKDNNFNFVKFKFFFELPGNIEDKKRTLSIQKKLLKIKGKAKLETEQKKNENSKIKCVGLTIETRPDFAKLKEANFMLELGCTRVELGIQTIYDDVLKKILRGHTVKDSIEATQILKDLGFKINYHIMPGLPSVTPKEDLYAFKELFFNQNFRPDMLKIYPCMVLKGTKLYKLWKKKEYAPLTTKKAANLIIKFKKYVPEYCRIMRVQRDIPTFVTEAGVDRTNLRQYINEIMKKRKIKCRCIRCREPKLKKINLKNTEIIIRGYQASNGIEFFISFEDVKNDILVGFCRLRFPYQFLRKEITTESALIRELHVFGVATAIGEKKYLQHKGIGKVLLEEAEDICKKYYKNKIVVISGIGVRNYYRKLGYKREGPYMVKYLNSKII